MPRHPNAQEITERRTKNAKHWQNPDGTRAAEFSTGTMHYRAIPGGPLLDKKQAFKSGPGTNEWISDESDVTMRTYQVGSGGSRRWWVEFKETLGGSGIAFELSVQPTVAAGSNVLTFADGWSYTHTRTGGKMLGPATPAPLGTRNYTFRYALLGGASALTQNADGSISCSNVFHMAAPHLIGADGMNYAYSSWTVDSAAGTLSFSYSDNGLPAGAYPYRVDPTTTFLNTDGFNDSSNYASAPTANGWPPSGFPTPTVATTAIDTYLVRELFNSQYQVGNAPMRWDTSSIGPTSTVTGAQLQIYVTGRSNTNNVSMCWGWFPNYTAGTADWTITPENDALADTLISTVNLSAVNTYTLLNAATNVNKTGYTGLRGHIADYTPAPTGRNLLQVAQLEHTTAQEPRLVVDYIGAETQVVIPIAASTDDQRVYRRGATYAGLDTATFTRDTTTQIDQHSNRGMIAASDYIITCGLFRFDTSIIPANATVTSARLRFYQQAKVAVDGLSLSIGYYDWDGTSTTDWTRIPETNAHAGTLLSSFASVAYSDIALANLSNINKTGFTRLRMHTSQRASDADPTGQNFLNIRSWDYDNANGHLGADPVSGTYYRPRLIVNYILPYDETLRPTSVTTVTGLTPTDSASATAIIDDDPDAGGTDFLTGTDPSAVTGATNGPEYPNARTGATGQTAFAWDNTTNVTDTSDTTLGIEPSASTSKGDYFTIPAAAFNDLPANATPTAISVAIKHRAGTANRVTVLAQLGTANGTLIGAEQTAIANLATTAGGVTHTVSSWGAVPTRAQLVSGTFGIRLRITRSNTATYELYSMKATVTYDVAAATTNTEVRAVMGDPTGSLATGTDTGQVKIQVKKLGGGSDPQARAEIREGGTLKATPIANTNVTAADADGEVLSGTFDQANITSKTNVDVWVVGTGASGGLVEIGAVEWNAKTAVADTFLPEGNRVLKRLIRR